MEYLPDFDIYLRSEGVKFTGRDVALLQAIDEHGSINRAADELGRSYSRAQQRIVELEGAFGDLVERTRGGEHGGGSRLTAQARSLATRYERLMVEFGGLAETAETVLPGQVVDRDGRLATVETAAGRVRGLVPVGDTDTRLVIRADAVTLQSPADSPGPDTTSARNRLEGTVVAVDPGPGVQQVAVDVGAAIDLKAIVTASSMEQLELEAGTPVVASFKATATRGIPADDGGDAD